MRLRVLVASDAIGGLDPVQASRAIARGWMDEAQVAVVPLADGGEPLGAALAALLDAELEVDGPRWRVRAGDTLAVGLRQADAPESGDDVDGSEPGDLYDWAVASLAAPTGVRRLVLDLTDADGGPDGATVETLRGRLGGVEVVGVVLAEQEGWKLLGLQGAVVRQGYEAGRDTAEILAEEKARAGWLAGLGVADAPGAGAGGGAGAVVLALGGRVVAGPKLCAELAGLSGTIAAADVVVTGCTSFDIGTRGGSAVGFVTEAATAALRPCLVFARESSVSRREMRTFGVEAAYATGPDTLPEALTAAVRRVATGWTGSSGSRVH